MNVSVSANPKFVWLQSRDRASLRQALEFDLLEVISRQGEIDLDEIQYRVTETLIRLSRNPDNSRVDFRKISRGAEWHLGEIRWQLQLSQGQFLLRLFVSGFPEASRWICLRFFKKPILQELRHTNAFQDRAIDSALEILKKHQRNLILVDIL